MLDHAAYTAPLPQLMMQVFVSQRSEGGSHHHLPGIRHLFAFHTRNETRNRTNPSPEPSRPTLLALGPQANPIKYRVKLY